MDALYPTNGSERNSTEPESAGAKPRYSPRAPSACTMARAVASGPRATMPRADCCCVLIVSKGCAVATAVAPYTAPLMAPYMDSRSALRRRTTPDPPSAMFRLI